MDNAQIEIYRGGNGEVRFNVDREQGTIWATRDQISRLFNVDKTVISRHVRNIFRDGELIEKQVSAKNALTAADGKTYMTNFYNLDMIISIGYRVNSKQATTFRIWATKVLRHYVVDGLAINQPRLAELDSKKLQEIEGTLVIVRRLLGSSVLSLSEANGILEVISKYSPSFTALKEFDEGAISFAKGKNKTIKILTLTECETIIAELKRTQKAGNLFGKPRGNSLDASLGAIFQTFVGKDLYPSLAEKAANLLYFIIKDHPFYDGNKRIGSLLFIIFLTINNFHLTKNGETKISDRALTALALLIAESSPKEKGLLIALICKLLEN